MACSRGADTRTLSQIQSEPGGKDARLWNKWSLKSCHHRCDVIKICGFLWEDLTLKHLHGDSVGFVLLDCVTQMTTVVLQTTKQ